MRSLKVCGMVALGVLASGLAVSDAQAGWRRWSCNSQPGYYYSTQTYWNAPVASPGVVTQGSQRYQSGYQATGTVAPVPAPTNVAPTGTYYYNNSGYYDSRPYDSGYHDRAGMPERPTHFQDRTFEEKTRADRKIYRGL